MNKKVYSKGLRVRIGIIGSIDFVFGFVDIYVGFQGFYCALLFSERIERGIWQEIVESFGILIIFKFRTFFFRELYVRVNFEVFQIELGIGITVVLKFFFSFM